MSHMTNPVPTAFSPALTRTARASRKPSGYDIARAYLDQQDQNNHLNHLSETRHLPLLPAPTWLAALTCRGAIRWFHQQAFLTQSRCPAGKDAAFGAGIRHKSRGSRFWLRLAQIKRPRPSPALQTLFRASNTTAGSRHRHQPPQRPATATDRASFWSRVLHMIVAPNIFLLLGNMLLLLPVLLRPQSLSQDMLLQTALLIKLSCNYMLPLLCGWAVMLYALRRRTGIVWPVAGLVSLASNSCWLLIDARVALIGGSVRVCTNMNGSSWNCFMLYLAATLPFFLLCPKRLRPNLTRTRRLDLGSTETFHDHDAHQARGSETLFHQDPGFLVNRWRH